MRTGMMGQLMSPLPKVLNLFSGIRQESSEVISSAASCNQGLGAWDMAEYQVTDPGLSQGHGEGGRSCVVYLWPRQSC